MRSLWATVYGAKNVQTYSCTDVHDEQHSGRPSILAETITKVEQEQEMLENRHVTVRELCILSPDVSKSTIGNVVGELYDKGYTKKKCHSACKSASIATVIMSEYC